MAFEFTDDNFSTEALQADTPVLVDFWAPWCMPCRMIAPMVEELAEENSGIAKIGKLNIDDNKQTAIAYGVQSIPTLVLLKNGEPVNRWVGAPGKAALQEAIDAAAGPSS